MTRLLLLLLIAFSVTGCIFIALNRGPVQIQDTDSHNSSSTNKASTFDVNVSPR